MRLSVNPNDPGYDPIRALDAIVTLNGRLVSLCETADEEEGLVIVLATDKMGYTLAEPNGDILKQTVRGKVVIVFRDPQKR